ncbi:MAG: peptidoglycan-binding protein [Faecousia sp.]
MSSRDSEFFVGKPIESMQYMLRILSMGDSRLVPVTPDGIYGQNTMAAVTAFQRSRRLPATGVMDLATWEQLVIAYEAEKILQDMAEPLIPILNPRQTIRPGETNYHVLLAQSILRTLHCVYKGLFPVSINGTMDAPTVAALRKFQTLSGLQPTGALDKNTWRHLARHYVLAAGNGVISGECISTGKI